MQEKVGEKVAKVLNITDTNILLNKPAEDTCKSCEDFKIFITELKEKCKMASHKEKIRLLTLVPSSWNIEHRTKKRGFCHFLKFIAKQPSVLSMWFKVF